MYDVLNDEALVMDEWAEMLEDDMVSDTEEGFMKGWHMAG